MRARMFYMYWFLVLVASHLFSQVKEISPDSVKAVVEVLQQVKLIADTEESRDDWKKLEQAAGSKLVGEYLTVSSGTGFFLDDRGDLITNHHVAVIEDEAETLANLASEVEDQITNGYSDEALPKDVKRALRRDAQSTITKARIETRVRLDDGTILPASLVVADKERDLALLNVRGMRTVSLPLDTDDRAPAVGTDVVAVGYPLPATFEAAFSEIKATYTFGRVSATRSDTWGIQHTAELNPGNSGGPLLGPNGRVIGVNVGRLTGSAGIGFAIGLRRLAEFLSEKGQFALWKRNQDMAGNPPLVPEFVHATGPLVTLTGAGGWQLAVNGNWVGPLPQQLEVPPGTLHAELRQGNAARRLALVNDGSGSVSSIDVNADVVRTVVVATTPPGAWVLIDDRTVGMSPVSVALPPGSHTVQAHIPNLQFADQTFTVGQDGPKQVALTGNRLHEVAWEHPLPPGTTLAFSGPGGSFEVPGGATLQVPDGRWRVEVRNGRYLKTTVLDLDSASLPKSLDPAVWSASGTVRFRGVVPGSDLSIDGTVFGQVESDRPYTIPAGPHEFVFHHDGYVGFTAKSTVEAGGVVEVVCSQNIDVGANTARWRTIWGYSTLGLWAVAIPASIWGGVQLQSSKTNSGTVPPLLYVGGYAAMAAALTTALYLFSNNSNEH